MYILFGVMVRYKFRYFIFGSGNWIVSENVFYHILSKI